MVVILEVPLLVDLEEALEEALLEVEVLEVALEAEALEAEARPEDGNVLIAVSEFSSRLNLIIHQNGSMKFSVILSHSRIYQKNVSVLK